MRSWPAGRRSSWWTNWPTPTPPVPATRSAGRTWRRLLDAGIDVYTTVNIQHFESLNDVVAQITGITVRETVPDRLLDLAFEITLIDIPPEDLLQRLHEGKVYIPDQAAKAMREVLPARQPDGPAGTVPAPHRRPGGRPDAGLHGDPVHRRALAGGGTAAGLRQRQPLQRKADPHHLPAGRRAEGPVVHGLHRNPESARQQQENRERIWRDLRLAESLGAQVATVTATSVAEAVIEYAVRHNITKIVVGKPTKSRWRELFRPPIVDQIIRLSGAIHVHVVSISVFP